MGFFDKSVGNTRAAEGAAATVAATAQATMLHAIAALDAAGRTPKDDYAAAKILVDYSSLYVSWLDRLAHLDLGLKWQPFVTALKKALAPILQKAIGPNVPESERAAATQWVSELLEATTGTLASHSVVAEMRGGALIYEIGRSVAESAGWPGDALVMEIGSNAAAVGLNALGAEALIAAAK